MMLWRLSVGKMTAQPPPHPQAEAEAQGAAGRSRIRAGRQAAKEAGDAREDPGRPRLHMLALLWRLLQHTACALMHPHAHPNVREADRQLCAC